jgi:hypothetical protein
MLPWTASELEWRFQISPEAWERPIFCVVNDLCKQMALGWDISTCKKACPLQLETNVIYVENLLGTIIIISLGRLSTESVQVRSFFRIFITNIF